MTPRAHSNSIYAIFLSMIVLCVPLFFTPVLPLVDFYDHVARYYVLSHLEQNQALQENYAASWKLLPNLGLDLISTPLLAFVSPLLAAKLIAAFVLIVQFSGILFLHNALWRRFDPLPIALLLGLLYSLIFTWGFSNFLLGLGLVFWNLGLWVKLRRRIWLAALVCGFGAVVIFFSHGFAFAIYGVLLGSFEFGRWWLDSRYDWPALAKSMAAALLQAVVPVALFLNMPTSIATAPGGANSPQAISGHLSGGTIFARLEVEFWNRLAYTFRVANSPYAILDYATFLVLLGLVIWAWRRKWVQLHPSLVLPLVAVALLCIVMPPTMFGVMRLSDRIPLVLALLVTAAISSASPAVAGTRRVLAMVLAIAAIRLVAIAAGWHEYSRHFADFRQVMAKVPAGALLTEVNPYAGAKIDVHPRCEMYRPLAVMLDGAIVPLFSFPTQQPIRLVGPLGDTWKNYPTAGPSWLGPASDYFDTLLAKIAADTSFEYVLMCRRDRLSKPLPPGVRVAAEAGDISLLKLR